MFKINSRQNRKHRSQSPHRRRGAVAVEMALVLPVFFILILGIVEVGRGFMVQHFLTEAARLGARRAVLDGSENSKVKKLVQELCADSLGAKKKYFDVSMEVSSGSGAAVDEDDFASATTGNLCTVTVSVSFDQVSFIAGSFLQGAELSGTCTMEHE